VPLPERSVLDDPAMGAEASALVQVHAVVDRSKRAMALFSSFGQAGVLLFESEILSQRFIEQPPQ
jgi:hypothetical protein